MCGLSRRKASSAASYTSPGSVRRRNFEHRHSPPEHRHIARLKNEDVSDNVVADVTPEPVLRCAGLRRPGRPRGFPTHRRIQRLAQTSRNSAALSESGSESVTAKDAETGRIDAGHIDLAASASGDDSNRSGATNGDHDYYQASNSNPSADIQPDRKPVLSTCRQLNLINHTLVNSSDSESVARRWENDVGLSCGVNGANPPCTSNSFLSDIESDHTYARRPPTAEELSVTKQRADEGIDNNVLARLTISNARSSRPARPTCRNVPAPMPCIQRCTVTLNKLNDAMFDLQPKLKLQLRALKRRSDEELPAVLNSEGWCGRSVGVPCTASAGECIASISDSASRTNASQSMKDALEQRPKLKLQLRSQKRRSDEELPAVWESDAWSSRSAGVPCTASAGGCLPPVFDGASAMNASQLMNDAVFEQHPKLKLQLRSLKRQSDEELPAVLESEGRSSRSAGVPCTSSAGACLLPVYDGATRMNATQSIDVSASYLESDLIQSSDLMFAAGDGRTIAGTMCRDWMPTRDSGLDLLASVSSLTADRLQQSHQPGNASSSDGPTYATLASTSPPTSHFTPPSAKRRIKVFCVRNKCSAGDPASKAAGVSPAELLDVVRDFVAKGCSRPVCGTFPIRSPGHSARQRSSSYGEQAEETVCNSLSFMHSSHSTLQNGLAELL